MTKYKKLQEMKICSGIFHMLVVQLYSARMSLSLFRLLQKFLRRMGGGLIQRIRGGTMKLISPLKNGMEDTNAMTLIKSNLIQFTNCSMHFACVDLMNLQIISKYSSA